MSKKITAILDGTAFYPIETFELKLNIKVKLTVETKLVEEEQLRIMTNDTDIINEISAINEEFMKTEMDLFSTSFN